MEKKRHVGLRLGAARKKIKKKVARKPAKKKTAKKAKRRVAKKKSSRKPAAKKKPKNLATRAKAELKRKRKSKKKIARKLTAQQILFVDCYLGAAKRTATKAAIMAGYSAKANSSQAATLMANRHVRSYLKRRQADIARRLDITQEKIAREMATLAFSKPTDFVRWEHGALTITDSDKIPDDLIGAVKSIEPVVIKGGRMGLKVKFYDKVAAGKLLAQHLGMLEPAARDGSKGIIVEAMEALHAQAVKLGKGKKE